MKIEKVDDIAAANSAARTKLRDVLSSLAPGEDTTLPDDEKWTVENIVEHISIVDSSALKIAGRLVKKGSNSTPNDGRAFVDGALFSALSGQSAAKLEAPDIVRPTGDIDLQKSLSILDLNDAEALTLYSELAARDLSEIKFPHPYFGDLNAYEWLLLKGGHEMRHTDQIGRILSKIRK